MDVFKEDLDDSALMCMSLVQKRKATGSINSKKLKQTKLDFEETSSDSGTTSQLSGSCSKSQEKTQKVDESVSSYFKSNKKINTCPLCLKSFESDSNYLTHMKQCAKKRQLTTQQLLSALKLQKEQMEQRRMLGLCSQIGPASRKTNTKKKTDDNADKYNLALGIALSKSLTSSKPETTVEELKFPPTSSNLPPPPSKKRNKSTKESVLRHRTVEERQRILTEKAAIILLEKDEEIDTGKRDSINLKNAQLANFVNKVPHLWNLGENEVTNKWYVDDMKPLMMTEESGRNMEKRVEKVELPKLSLPKEEIHQDWRKMINNQMHSDLMGKSKDFRTFYLHSLVVFARCPEILEKDYESIFEKFNMSTIQNFLEYLYCGTVNDLTAIEVKDLLDLAVSLNYEGLVRVLSCLDIDASEGSDGLIPSSLTLDENPLEEVAVLEKEEEKNVKAVREDEDLFEQDLVDLTQSSHSSTVCGEDGGKDEDGYESNEEKSFWSFIQHEKEREKNEEERIREEDHEKTIIREEREKIETSIREREEMMQKLSEEFEEEEANLNNSLELEKILLSQRRDSNDSATKDFDQKDEVKDNYECIVISSDSDTRASKPEEENMGEETTPQRIPSPMDLDYEVPNFDPYDNFNNMSRGVFSPVGPSQSFITGDVSLPVGKSNEEQEENKEENKRNAPEYFSTPVSNRRMSKIISSSKKSTEKGKRRRSDLSSSRIISKSLGLDLKKRNSRPNSVNKKKGRKSRVGGEKFVEALTHSILNDFSNSPLMKSSTPVKRNSFVEITPVCSRDEFGESVTPSPNFSNMSEALLKEHLSKYGLKRNLAKSKAQKILRHIYEELHPLLNTKTGKIVRKLSTDTPKVPKKTKARTTRVKKNTINAKAKQKKSNSAKNKNEEDLKQLNSSKESDLVSPLSPCSLDRSTIYDSDGSEFGDLNEPLTQSVPNNPVDLPSAFVEYLDKNPEFHQKILMYEPVWVEDLQSKLKEAFKKHFKLADLMDYLDQKCITFRSEAQKRSNEKRNEKKKQSPKKKNRSSS